VSAIFQIVYENFKQGQNRYLPTKIHFIKMNFHKISTQFQSFPLSKNITILPSLSNIPIGSLSLTQPSSSSNPPNPQENHYNNHAYGYLEVY
jgi:hypothetical protein